LTGSSDITSLLARMAAGDRDALDELTPLVYDELHRLAKAQFGRQDARNILQPTALVNEVWLKLSKASVDWTDRTHFFALAARMMRRILVDHAKARRRIKRGGSRLQVTFDEALLGEPQQNEDVLELDEALQALEAIDREQAEIVELFYFGGMSYQQVGEVRGVSAATVKRKLRFARAWMLRYLSEQDR
jgi:RNA polymerase sigma-70 factor, ECF subfamily